MEHFKRDLKHELPEDIDFDSSVGQVREFEENITWSDMARFLDDHILWGCGRHEDVKSGEEWECYQGQIKMARTILGLPDYIREQRELETHAEGTNGRSESWDGRE